jgi:CrcB protein
MTPTGRRWGVGIGGRAVQTLIQIGSVAAGSALGGVTRWAVALWFGRWFGTGFPWGTMFINISGSLFLGWFLTVLDDRLTLSESSWFQADTMKLLIATGFTGAYTTFSTFEYETHGLIREGNVLTGAAYVAVSVFVGLLAVRLGVILARPQ